MSGSRGASKAGCRTAPFLAVACALALAGLPSTAAAATPTATEFSTGISPGSSPLSITAGPDGNLWFTENDDRIGRITTSGTVTEFSAGISPGAGPNGITAGP